MADLNPTPDLIAIARRIRDTRVEADHDEPPAKDPLIEQLRRAGLVRWAQAPAIRLAPGEPRPVDCWRLTDVGRAWLGEHDTTETHDDR